MHEHYPSDGYCKTEKVSDIMGVKKGIVVTVFVSLVLSLLILSVSAVPIIPDPPGVSTDKSSICCGDQITVIVPIKNLQSVTKYLQVYIVIKDPSGAKIIDDVKYVTLAPYEQKTFYYTYSIPKPCTNFGTYTVYVTVKEGSTVHDSDTTTFQVNDCDGGGGGDCDTQLTSEFSTQDRPSMIYSNNYFYVAYQSWETGETYNGDIFVKKFDSTWHEAKKAQITSSSYYQDSPSLVFANNKLYIALVTNHGGDYDVYLKEYDSNLNYITERYLTTLPSMQDMPSLFYKDGYFYLAYQSWETGSSYQGDIYLKKFDSGWNEVKKVRVTSDPSYEDRPSLIYANGYFYVAYFSEETGNFDIFVKRLDTNLNVASWKKQITSEASDQSFPSLAYVNNDFAIAYASDEGGTLGIFMKRYDSSWNFIEKIEVIDDGSAHERRPSMTYALDDYWLTYVHNVEGSDDWNIYSKPDVCPDEEKPSPEIIDVSVDPPTCVNEGETATISVSVRNNGGASSVGYISVSFPNDEEVTDVSGTGNTYNNLYPKGSLIWNSNDQQMVSVDPLVELCEVNWGKGQEETISMAVTPNSGSDEIVFYVRAALKNDADGSYERDPESSVYTDQQSWPVERHVIEVCPSECMAEVKFKGTATADETNEPWTCYGSYYCNVSVEEKLDDPGNFLHVGEVYTVAYGQDPKYIKSGDNLEVYGIYYRTCGPLGCIGCIAATSDPYYVRVEKSEIKFNGTVTGISPTLIGAGWWNVTVEEVISGPEPCSNEITVNWIAYPPWGYIDLNITIGDKVEVYGGYYEDQYGCNVSLNGKEEYYIKKIETLPKAIYVDDDFIDAPPNHKWDTIQEGINDAANGDTILVYPGNYTENVEITESLTIKSTSGNPEDTIVQAANSDDHVFYVRSDYVNISGFTIKETRYNRAGIYLDHVNRCTINNTNSSNNGYGIYMYLSSNNNILTNNLSNNWYGIYLNSSGKCNISNNIINFNLNGIILERSYNNCIHNNEVLGNVFLLTDIHLSYSDENIIENNILGTLNLLYSTKNIFKQNNFVDSITPWSYNVAPWLYIGGDKKEDFDNEIETSNTYRGKSIYYYFDKDDLKIEKLNAGLIGLAFCEDCTIEDNNIEEGQGVYLFSNCNNNVIRNNIISGNSSGIYLEKGNLNIIENNNLNNTRIKFYSSQQNIIKVNTLNYWSWIYFWDSQQNIIESNSLNQTGIDLCNSSQNEIISNNLYGEYDPWVVVLNLREASDDNAIHHNNFFSESTQVRDDCVNNAWDDGYPSGGNYWSNYEERYPDAEEIDDTGIWDTPYDIPGGAGAKDNYPLVEPWGEIEVGGLDDDGDGVINLYDKCKNTPGPACNNGCPTTTDNDGDGLQEDSPTCPNYDEYPNDYDNDGDPDSYDCAPSDADRHHGAKENVTNGVDDDCDGKIDESICIDNDGDGYGEDCLLGIDCDDSNPDIHPLAAEICGDGIDQDCSGSDLPCPLDGLTATIEIDSVSLSTTNELKNVLEKNNIAETSYGGSDSCPTLLVDPCLGNIFKNPYTKDYSSVLYLPKGKEITVKVRLNGIPEGPHNVLLIPPEAYYWKFTDEPTVSIENGGEVWEYKIKALYGKFLPLAQIGDYGSLMLFYGDGKGILNSHLKGYTHDPKEVHQKALFVYPELLKFYAVYIDSENGKIKKGREIKSSYYDGWLSSPVSCWNPYSKQGVRCEYFDAYDFESKVVLVYDSDFSVSKEEVLALAYEYGGHIITALGMFGGSSIMAGLGGDISSVSLMFQMGNDVNAPIEAGKISMRIGQYSPEFRDWFNGIGTSTRDSSKVYYTGTIQKKNPK